jgi:hypothetical protein
MLWLRAIADALSHDPVATAPRWEITLRSHPQPERFAPRR